MNNMIKVLLVVFISFLSSPSFSETVTKDDLVKRNGFYYKKFTDVPFTGKVTGQWNGKLKNGKLNGLWTFYRENGQLMSKSIFTDGKRDGVYEEYHETGELKELKIYKDGKLDGQEEEYYKNGRFKYYGKYENGSR